MGVRSLESYLEKESRSACYNVNINHIAHNYRMKTKSTPVVVVDGMSCLRPLYNKLSWVNGGQFKEFQDIVNTFVQNFTKIGCELVVFFDGPVQNVKLPSWKKRRLQSAHEISLIFDKLDLGTQYIEKNTNSTCLPNGIGMIFLYILSQQKNCRVLKALKECDEEIAQYASTKKCFAILGQDTDYVIYQGALYYLSIKHLDIDKMTTICYNRFNLCKELNIHLHNLPLFASLMGNDIVEFDSLKPFHYKLRRGRKMHMAVCIANFIRDLNSIDFGQIAKIALGSIDKACILEQSVSSYNLKMTSHVSGDSSDTGLVTEWSKMCKFAEEKYINSFYPAPLYDILLNNQFHSSTCLEDYRRENMIIPVGLVLKELRRFIYGILLYEQHLHQGSCPMVKELVMTGFESMKDYVNVEPMFLKTVKHPGLVALWTSKDKSIDDIKWSILGEIFKTDPLAIKELPLYFVVPALSARYFKDQFPAITEWELDAFIASCVCCSHYSSQDLAKLPSDPLEYRQIWIYTVLSRTFSNVTNLVFYIGEPVSFEFTMPSKFTDGKLFHEKYRQSCKTRKIEDLCEYKVENLEQFNSLKSFIMKDLN